MQVKPGLIVLKEHNVAPSRSRFLNSRNGTIKTLSNGFV
jgi:hypothetical protein